MDTDPQLLIITFSVGDKICIRIQDPYRLCLDLDPFKMIPVRIRITGPGFVSLVDSLGFVYLFIITLLRHISLIPSPPAGNLELNITDEEMKRIFGRYGELVDIDIKRPPPGTGNAYAFIRDVADRELCV